MDKMTIVITMAGLGSRFRKAGYNVPKYMIQAKGKTLFEWSMDSLIDYNKHVDKYVFVVRKEDEASRFIRSKCEKYGIKSVVLVELDYLTDGQATTAKLAIPFCDEKLPVMFYNIDTYVEPGEMKFSDIKGDGYLPCFHSDGDHWSFARTDKEGKVVEVREKKRISDNCTLGAYYFSSASLYNRLYQEYYTDGNNLELKEKYIAPLYNQMIKQGLVVQISIVNHTKVHVLGTPEELEQFVSTNP
ncbi:MAG: glycosyltransferase family 2 protein [Butyrivibrio sp.]|nr:glycosyltransferase family 2 protein [Butyrivibrio sp.]